jgi:hypothetical protein
VDELSIATHAATKFQNRMHSRFRPGAGLSPRALPDQALRLVRLALPFRTRHRAIPHTGWTLPGASRSQEASDRRELLWVGIVRGARPHQ